MCVNTICSNTNTELVSVIIPVYKTEKYLLAAVDSVLHQSYRNIEVILVDDGSPDNCPAMCDALSEKYEHIRVIHQENGGLSAARNTGTQAATGTFLLYLDSDDTLIEDAIEEMVKIAVREGSDAVYPNQYYQIEEATQKKTLRYHFFNDWMCDEPVQFALNVLIGKGRAWRAHSLLYRTSTINDNQISFPVGVTSEDIFFNLRFLSKAKKISFMQKPTVNYYKHSGSITTSYNPDFIDTIFLIDDYVKDFLEATHIDPAIGEPKRATLLLRNCVAFLIKVENKNLNPCTSAERKRRFMEIVQDPRVQAASRLAVEKPYFQSKTVALYFQLMYRLLRKGYYNTAETLTSIAANRL